jgi:membrane protein YdbS with pleckstrin-like domain
MAMAPATETSVVSLRPPRHRVSRKAFPYWATRAGAGWLVALGIQVGWLVLSNDTGAVRVGILVGSIALAVLHVSIMPLWRFRVHRWEATAEAVYTQSGWFNRTWRIAPVSRIQTVDSHRGPWEQVFGLASVTVTTASAAGPIRIEGLDNSTAQQLIDDLTANTQATPGDAT